MQCHHFGNIYSHWVPSAFVREDLTLGSLRGIRTMGLRRTVAIESEKVGIVNLWLAHSDQEALGSSV